MWRPISEAPQDGGEMLVCTLYDDGTAHYDVASVLWHEKDGAPAWFNGDVVVEPTHWMPLPAPPTA